MNYWQLMRNINNVCHFMSRERPGKVSNSELKRWLQNKAVEVNGVRPKWDDEVDYPIKSMVLFPKNGRVTLR